MVFCYTHKSVPSPIFRRLEEEGIGLWELVILRTPGEHGLQNQLSRDHGGIQTLEWQPQSLCICCGYLAWCFCWTPNNGNLLSLTLLPTDGALFLLWGCITQPWYESLYLIWLFLVMSYSIDITGRHAFSEGKQRRNVSGGERRRGEVVSSGGRAVCSQDVLSERRILKIGYFNKFLIKIYHSPLLFLLPATPRDLP